MWRDTLRAETNKKYFNFKQLDSYVCVGIYHMYRLSSSVPVSLKNYMNLFGLNPGDLYIILYYTRLTRSVAFFQNVISCSHVMCGYAIRVFTYIDTSYGLALRKPYRLFPLIPPSSLKSWQETCINGHVLAIFSSCVPCCLESPCAPIIITAIANTDRASKVPQKPVRA